MQAGFAKFPVGKVEHAGTPRVQVLFAAIPEEPAERIQFHNMLVDACQVSVRTWADALSKQEQKASGKRKAPDTEENAEGVKEENEDT